MTKRYIGWLAVGATSALFSCGDAAPPTDESASADPSAAAAPVAAVPAPPQAWPVPNEIIIGSPSENAERSAFFGDLHVHTTYSFDAFSFGTLNSPYDAYRYARGGTIQHPAGFDMRLREPLDFYAVTDHAMYLGLNRAAADTSSALAQTGRFDYMANLNAPENQVPGGNPNRSMAFSNFGRDVRAALDDGTVDVDMLYSISRDAWSDTIRAAEEFNAPGVFTTFVAYEYTTSSDDRGNLHRNVFFRDADKLPAVPFARYHSRNPEDLWRWMDDLRSRGIESMAIPHNANGSNGQMFKLVDWAGDPMDDEYAERRIRNEPLIEITQIKGTSETHPALSDTDEWANFEIMPFRIATRLHSEPSGSYAREALINGLAFADLGITNPYQFGFVGASDTHTAAIADDESNFYGKIGLLDAGGDNKGSLPLDPDDARTAIENAPDTVKTFGDKSYFDGPRNTWGASGLAGVWAEENTRDAIYDALRRKETFATSGPRIKVRLFGGYEFPAGILDRPDAISQAYATGVAMGSNLVASESVAPSFVAWAAADLQSANLDRVQIIKGWTENGEHNEQVFDVACSIGEPDPATHRCEDNGARVDLDTCAITEGVGATTISTVWTDPSFEPSHRAFYYLRALENPTCRWSTWDAVKAGVPPRPDLAPTIQERAWTSPIWYSPS